MSDENDGDNINEENDEDNLELDIQWNIIRLQQINLIIIYK